MGFFDSLVSAVSNASEAAHGTRIRNEFDDSVRRIAPLEGRDEVIKRFVSRRAAIQHEKHNWSRDGTLSQASLLRNKARQTFDLNIVEGYSLWLTSAWLEASVRQSADAQHVWHQLDQLAAQHDAIRTDANVALRVQRARNLEKENEIKLLTERATAAALSERQVAARKLTKEVEIQLSILQGNWEVNEDTPNVRNLRKALRRIVEIGFRTTSAPDLRHVSWDSDIADKVIACSVGLGIASADVDLSEPAFHIAHCAHYLESQGCGPQMLRCYQMLSIDEYYAKPDAALGTLVRVARDAMEAYLDGDRLALETLKSVLH